MTEDVLAQGDETRGHVPLISVIIPVYDQGRFLSCSVKSSYSYYIFTGIALFDLICRIGNIAVADIPEA